MGGVPYKGRGVGAACMELWGVDRWGPLQGKRDPTGAQTKPRSEGLLEARLHKQSMPYAAWPSPHTWVPPPTKEQEQGLPAGAAAGASDGQGGVEP